MKTLAERLTWAREKKGLTQASLAKLSGVTQSTIGNLESGLRQTARKILDIATALDVDPMWLANGQGEAQPSGHSSVSTANQSPAEDSPFKPAELRLRVGEDPDSLPIRRVTVEVRAGITGFDTVPDLRDDGVLYMPRKDIEEMDLQPHALIAVRVRGDSMEPMLADGDSIVINTLNKTPTHKGLFAVNFKGESCVKQLLHRGGQWYLHSINLDHEMVNVRSGECEIVGEVVYQPGRRLVKRS